MDLEAGYIGNVPRYVYYPYYPYFDLVLVYLTLGSSHMDNLYTIFPYNSLWIFKSQVHP